MKTPIQSILADFIRIVCIWIGLALCADALTRQEALQKVGETVGPSTSNDALSAWMTPAPLAAGLLTEIDGDPPSIDLDALANPVWLAFVDPEPCAMLEHDVVWLLIDDVTGVVSSFAAENLPAIDGNAIADGALVGGRLIQIYSGIPRPEAVAAGAAEPPGDYGDAPENAPAYPGVPGAFPTHFSTPNALAGRKGGHTTILGEDSLGTAASSEAGPIDPADPDGTPNLVDADSDQRIFHTWDPNTTPPTSHLIFDVTIAPGAGNGQRFVNAAIDLNTDGKWKAGSAVEWVVVNQSLPALTAGTTTTHITPAFSWGAPGDAEGPTLCWARLLLTRDEAIAPAIFGPDGWDGSGEFLHGEVEDFKLYRHWCPGEGCPPPPGSPPEFPPPPETPPPFPPIGWDLLPVNSWALVVEGVDNPGQSAADEAADGMERLLRTQGFKTTHLDGNAGGAAAATADNIEDWLLKVKAKVKCQDHILIYFIAHGKKNTPGGSMHLRHAKSGDNGRMTGAELADLLMLIPPCPNEDCDVKGKCCDVTVIVESCYAGQFLAGLSGPGRNIITTSEATTPSYFGKDGTGGAYSDTYAECADPANASSVDGGGGEDVDGAINPAELHAWAATSIGMPYGKTQIPQNNNQTCKCICPPRIPDCLCDGFGGVYFGSALWLAGGVPVGETFEEFPIPFIPPFGVPLYRVKDVAEVPDEWRWPAMVPCGNNRMAQIQVLVQNIPPIAEVHVPLFCLDTNVLPPGTSPIPFQLSVDIAANQYFLQSSEPAGDPIEMAGPWHRFALDIAEHPLLFEVPAYRVNRIGNAEGPEIEIEFVNPGDNAGPFFDLNWRPKLDSFYLLEKFDEDTDTWMEVSPPLFNASLVLDKDPLIPREILRVRYESIFDLPPL